VGGAQPLRRSRNCASVGIERIFDVFGQQVEPFAKAPFVKQRSLQIEELFDLMLQSAETRKGGSVLQASITSCSHAAPAASISGQLLPVIRSTQR
jgi:hypothetical protein